MLALFAGVEIESAFRTLAYGIGEVLEQGSAFGATGNGAGTGHLHGPRSKSVFFLRGFGGVIELFLGAAA